MDGQRGRKGRRVSLGIGTWGGGNKGINNRKWGVDGMGGSKEGDKEEGMLRKWMGREEWDGERVGLGRKGK